MRQSIRKYSLIATVIGSLFAAPIAGYTRPQEKPKSQKPADTRFEQMAQISERSLRAARYASRIKARFAKQPQIAAAAQKKYEAAKDKFESWINVLALAITHKQKQQMEGPQFKSIAESASAAANDFDVYAEKLLNPFDVTDAFAKKGGAQSMADEKVAATNTAATGPEPNPIPLFAQIIVGIAFEVYNRYQDRKTAERAQFVADMRELISWKEWPDIKLDDSIQALPGPKPSPTAPAPPKP
jgi:hypothetical protein